MNTGCEGVPAKTEASVTIKVSGRTAADPQRCLEKLTSQFPYTTAQSVT